MVARQPEGSGALAITVPKLRFIPKDAFHRLTTNQGLVFADGLFGRIYGMLLTAVKGEVDTCEIPKFYCSAKSDFDATNLRNYLVSMLSELQSRQLTSVTERHAYLINKKKPCLTWRPLPPAISRVAPCLPGVLAANG